jgi:UDP-N-acetylmuramate-alanine ligase
MIERRLTALFVLSAAVLHGTTGTSNNTLIEQQLETEFDLREPRSFSDRSFEYLVVRNVGFDHINHYTKDGDYVSTDHIANWERFALK